MADPYSQGSGVVLLDGVPVINVNTNNTFTGTQTFNANVTFGSGTASKVTFGDGTTNTFISLKALTSNPTTASGQYYIYQDATNNMVFAAGNSSKNFKWFNTTNTLLASMGTSSGQFNNYGKITTAGVGLAAIYKTDIESQTNTAPTGFSYTPPATAGTYRVSGFIEVTTGTTLALKLKVTYKTPSAASGSDEMVFVLQNSTTLLTSIITTGRYYFSQIIGIDNSATAIALSDNAGTYTTCVYSINAVLEQLQ